MYDWYEKHLGIEREPDGSGAVFRWREAEGIAEGMTVLGIFPKDTKYFNPSSSDFMLNYRVENLDELLDALRKES